MTISFSIGKYSARLASSREDLLVCQTLRHRCFYGCDGIDADKFDPLCRHLMVEQDGRLVATCRVMILTSGAQIDMSYSAQSYDLKKLSEFKAPMLEVGRFCISETANNLDILRICWGALAQLVDRTDVAMMFGCTSFLGNDPMLYRDGFGLLAKRYLAPASYAPCQSAPDVVALASGRKIELKSAVTQLPPLLRSYLAMGGWVSDHAVIDHDLNTLHVFTGLEVASIPPSRVRALRSVIAEAA